METLSDYQIQRRLDYTNKLRRDYESTCPPLYRNTDGKFGKINQEALKKVQAYNYNSSRGLFLYGETGCGKTTATWMLIRRLMCVNAVNVMAIRDPEFSREYSMKLGNGTADEWIDKLCKAQILFIDDLGKSATTPRYKEQLHDVLDARINYFKPTIITSQYDAARLIERFGDEDGNGIIRRIIEFCEIINF